MTTDTEARELVDRLFGYQVRTGHTIQSGAGTKAPTLIWADADYEVGDGLCGLHPDQKQANEPSIPYARIDAVFALLAENERLRVECARRAALVGFAYAEGVLDVEVRGANTENVDLRFGSSDARAALDDPEVHQAEWPEHYQDAIRDLRK